MNEILEFLNKYGLILEDCNDDWIEKVKNFQTIESTLTPESRQDKIEHLIKIFDDYHEVKDPDPEPVKKGRKSKKEGIVENTDDDERIKIEHNTERVQKRFDANKKRGSKFDLTNLLD